VGGILVLACSASASLASGSASAASACSNTTANGGKYVGKLTLRFGKVSCAEAHRTVGAYYRKMAAGGCGAQNNFCDLELHGAGPVRSCSPRSPK